MNAKQPEKVYEPRTTYLSEKGVVVLLEHALGLPVGTPAREIIQLLAERWHEGKPVAYECTDDEATISRATIVTMLRSEESAADVVQMLCEFFEIKDSETSDEELRELMEAA